MPEFVYTARDGRGQKVSGKIEAVTERDAIGLLAGQSLFPLEVKSDAPVKTALSKRRVKGQVMATSYGQLAALLRGGVPLLRSLAVLREQSSNASLKAIITEIHDRVEEGSTMADAMARFPKAFNEMSVSMVRAGAEGGFLEDALDRVATFTEQAEDLKARTVGALAYPAFLGVVGTTVVSVLVVFFVPKFATMFDRLRDRGELPIMTDWLLGFSELVRSYGIFIAIAAIAVFLFLRVKLETEEGKLRRDLVKLKTPLAGPIFRNLAVARFCRVFGTLLKNGVPILKSLEISREATGNRVLSAAIAEASENISAGQSLAAPLKSSGHFPVTVIEMISVAEESNTLDKVLVEVADSLERSTSRRLELMVRLLEPIMLLILAGVVLFVVMALLLPVIKMSGTI